MAGVMQCGAFPWELSLWCCTSLGPSKGFSSATMRCTSGGLGLDKVNELLQKVGEEEDRDVREF